MEWGAGAAHARGFSIVAVASSADLRGLKQLSRFRASSGGLCIFSSVVRSDTTSELRSQRLQDRASPGSPGRARFSRSGQRRDDRSTPAADRVSWFRQVLGRGPIGRGAIAADLSARSPVR
jgi:hypothetical protein